MPSFRAQMQKPRIGLSLRVLALIGFGVVLLLAAVAFVATPQKAAPSLIGGPFKLENAQGQTVTEADFRGHPFFVYFGYTHCPDICPTTLAQISDVLAKLPGKDIKALFITIDPERDTPKLMADYVSSFDPRIIGLSGTADEVAAAEKGYRVYARKAPTKDGDYSMDHSSIVYLMNKQGAFVEAFNLERTPEDSAKELADYL